MSLRITSIILFLCLGNAVMADEPNKCIQKNGTVTYTDKACPKGSKVEKIVIKKDTPALAAYSNPSFLDELKSFYHRFFPEYKAGQTANAGLSPLNQSTPAPAPVKNSQACVNNKRTSHFNQGGSARGFDPTQGC